MFKKISFLSLFVVTAAQADVRAQDGGATMASSAHVKNFEQLMAKYNDQIKRFDRDITTQSLLYRSLNRCLTKGELDQMKEEYDELVCALDAVVECVNSNAENPEFCKAVDIDTYQRMFDLHKTTVLPSYKRYIGGVEWDRSLFVGNVVRHWKDLHDQEWFCKWIEKIGMVSALVGGSYLTLASYFNVTWPDVSSAASAFLFVGLVSFVFGYFSHCGNLDAQVNLRNAIRDHGLCDEKELEGWEKDIHKQWNLVTSV
jgi:hypothetical protein